MEVGSYPLSDREPFDHRKVHIFDTRRPHETERYRSGAILILIGENFAVCHGYHGRTPRIRVPLHEGVDSRGDDMAIRKSELLDPVIITLLSLGQKKWLSGHLVAASVEGTTACGSPRV